MRVHSLSNSILPLVIAIIALSTVVIPGLVHTPLLAQSSSVDFSTEYSSGDVQIFPYSQAWYTWISINGTHTIFLALHSTELPSPVSAFVGQSYNTSTNARVFVANVPMAMEVYNDTNHNGMLDANYALAQTELVYTITMNASQAFTPTSVQKIVTNGVPHYTWGVTYGSIQGGLLKVDPAYGYAYDAGQNGAQVMIDHLSLFYDYSVAGNATYLKTSYEIGNVTLSNPTQPNITLKGLSLSLLHFTLAVSTAPYTITANTAPYDSQTSQTSSLVNVAQVKVDNSLAYEFRFNDNYTRETNPPASLRTSYAAASSNSLPANAFQSQGALQLIRAQDYVKASLPSIAGLPASSDLNYNTSKLIYRISYPTWGGIGIIHDPTYVGYFIPRLILVSLPVLWDPTIIYLAVGIAAVAVAAFLIVKGTRRTRTQSQNDASLTSP